MQTGSDETIKDIVQWSVCKKMRVDLVRQAWAQFLCRPRAIPIFRQDIKSQLLLLYKTAISCHIRP